MSEEQSPVSRTADPAPPRDGDVSAAERTADPVTTEDATVE